MNALMVINLVVNGLLTIVVAWVAAKTRRIESLESRLEAKAEQLIDSRMSAKTGELMTEVRVMMAEMRQINARLQNGDRAFGEIFDKSHALEIKIIERISQTCATREDVRHLSQRFDSLQQAVARALVAKLEQEQL